MPPGQGRDRADGSIHNLTPSSYGTLVYTLVSAVHRPQPDSSRILTPYPIEYYSGFYKTRSHVANSKAEHLPEKFSICSLCFATNHGERDGSVIPRSFLIENVPHCYGCLVLSRAIEQSPLLGRKANSLPSYATEY